MYRIFKKTIFPSIFFTLTAIFLPLFVHAVDSLDVVFTPDPLFSEINFWPGSEATGTVAVTNNSTTTQEIITEAINITDAGGLGAALVVTISDVAGPIYENTLANFLRGGEVALFPLTIGSSKTYEFTITFDEDAPDALQGATLGFDLCVGFRGGNRTCGDTVISGEEDTENGDPPEGGGGSGGTLPGSGGGGGGFVSPPAPGGLVILGIQAYATGDLLPGEVRIVWDTNYLSTSQVAYGLASLGPYSIDINDPNFGYPSATAKDSNKVTHHSVVISGLTDGVTYLYRVISTASPATVSFEHSFTVPVGGASSGVVLTDIAGNGHSDSEIRNMVNIERKMGEGVSLQRDPAVTGILARNRGVDERRSVSSMIRGDGGGNRAAPTFSNTENLPEPATTLNEADVMESEPNRNAATALFSILFDGSNWIVTMLATFFLFLSVCLGMRRKSETARI